MLQRVLLHSNGEVRTPGYNRGYEECGRSIGIGRFGNIPSSQSSLQPEQPYRGMGTTGAIFFLYSTA
jgi:hypothetical protein